MAMGNKNYINKNIHKARVVRGKGLNKTTLNKAVTVRRQ
jgi:hypothetical protein